MNTADAWYRVLRDAGYRVVPVDYVMGEVNPEFVFDDTPTTTPMTDATLGMPMAPSRIRP